MVIPLLRGDAPPVPGPTVKHVLPQPLPTTVTTKGTLKKMGKGIFNKLRALNIYDDPGERLRPLSELNEDQMNTLLADASKDRILCPLCEAPLRSGSDNSLLVHLQNYHSNRDTLLW